MPDPKSETAEADVRFERVPLTAVSWGVQCPGCGETIEIDDCQIGQDAAGFWRVNGPDQFLECTSCASHIEVTPIAITEANS